MTSNSTSNSTAIELSSPQSESTTAHIRQTHTATQPTPDNILHASQIADSTVPDGGYGWAVIFGGSVLAFWFVGTIYSWGIIQAALLKEGLSSASTLSFVGSTLSADVSFLALINARIIRLLGARRTALIGTTLLGMGEILSGFATKNLAGLFVTVGVVMGPGVRYLLSVALNFHYRIISLNKMISAHLVQQTVSASW